MLILNSDYKEDMNNTFNAIVSSEIEYKHRFCECVFLSSLEIHCTQNLPGTKDYFRLNASNFFYWLNEFLAANKLYFPYAENLFFTLMVCLLASHIDLLGSLSTGTIIRLLVKRLQMLVVSVEKLIDIHTLDEGNKRCNEMCFVKKSSELESCPCFCCENYQC